MNPVQLAKPLRDKNEWISAVDLQFKCWKFFPAIILHIYIYIKECSEETQKYKVLFSCLFPSHLSMTFKRLLSLSLQRSISGLYHHFHHLQRSRVWSVLDVVTEHASLCNLLELALKLFIHSVTFEYCVASLNFQNLHHSRFIILKY